MDREWNAKEVESLIKLIDDPRHGITKKGNCSFTEEQAKAILELRLQRLTAMGIGEIQKELDELKSKIEELLLTLDDRVKIYKIIKEELLFVKDNFSIPRRSEILGELDDVQDEDLKDKINLLLSDNKKLKKENSLLQQKVSYLKILDTRTPLCTPHPGQ